MNLDPFYVSTENITPSQVRELFDLMVKCGATSYLNTAKGLMGYEELLHTFPSWKYFGNSFKNELCLSDCFYDFGEEGVELTYEEARDYLQNESAKSLNILEVGKTKRPLTFKNDGKIDGCWVRSSW